MSAVDTHSTIREQAAQRFGQLGWPTPRQEEWKYTNVAPIAKVDWHVGQAPSPVTGKAPSPVTGEAPSPVVSKAWAPDLRQPRALIELVFVNGMFVERSGDGAPGLHVSRLAESTNEHLGKYADYQNHPFTALNTAHFDDGALVVADGAVEGFVHILYVSSGNETWSHPRNLIIANRGAQLTVVETYTGDGRYFTNAVTEIVAGDGAVVDHYKLECESIDAYHVGTVQIHQERSSSVTAHSVAIGGALVRNEVNAALKGEGSSLALEGLFIGAGTQHLDNKSVIDHARPHCESMELYKGILDDNARGIFDGRIIVGVGAQKTVAKQTNNNLLLSETAIVDSKPTLEIHNDDVKCNHGSTIGQLAEEPLFYLRSRGIGEEEARGLLIYAFASEIVDRMKVEPVREAIRRAMFRQMPERLPERRGGRP
jgi:Fe-S cluster assembly protein SufD